MKTIKKVVGMIVGIAGVAGGIAFIAERFEKPTHKPLGIYEEYVKRPLDAFLSTGALIVFSPIMLITAVLVRLKLGSPILFAQERPGRDEKTFKLYKFRSMTDQKDENGKLLPDDVRLTKFGRILRSTSLDELPELINIIKGDMAVIGPRPLRVHYLPWYSEEQAHRHDIRPGLTGYAQAHGRNALSWDEKFAKDVEYAKHITFSGDCRIIWDTVKEVLKREGITPGTSATKIRADEYDVAIVVGWELMKTVDSKLGGDFLGRAAYYEKEGKGIELPFPKLFGRLADETLKKYPELDEKRYMDALAKISVINYSNAKRNPLAQTRKWFMNYDQASTRGTDTNPLVGGKLGVSDCSQVADGAAVVVLCSERFLAERGYQDKPVIKGYGHRTAPMLFDKKMADNEGSGYILPWTRQAVLDAYKRAGLTVDDIDVFETHDCFTSSEYAVISAFGLTAPGKEYEAVESGLINFGGEKPINPSGGLIGCGHPVGASGARMFLDLYKQVTGTAGGYQVEGIKNGMMLNIGGSATTNYVFIVGKE